MYQTAFGRNIYTTSSGIQVYQNRKYRWLSFSKNIIQTQINRYAPERGGLRYVQAVVQLILAMPGDTCLLGLGGAGVAHALFSSLEKSTITAVEASQEVIDIAATYFYLERIRNLTLTCRRAETFVQSSKNTYTTLLVDLHDGVDFPATCTEALFWQHCRHLLRPGGMLIVNLLHVKKKLSLFKTIQQTFDGCTLVIPIVNSSNTLIVAYHATTGFIPMPHQHLFSQLIWDAYWGRIGQLK